ncbi:MAG: molecular chaperone HtpG [Flavobacteriales bacterium]
MIKGNINVQTENIFPIIKKFLYSDTEIFLRELVSNAVDATTKLKTLSSTGEFKGDLNNTRVEVILDKKAKTIIIRDRGIGMTSEEIEKYINQIAFSGAEEFVKQYQDKSQGIIGHFGLGFYSAFMVADKVQIKTLSFKDGAKPVLWESNGTPEFAITETDKDERGTDIILHVNPESKEFLEESRLKGILNKYCKFLPVEIVFGTKDVYEDDPSRAKDEHDLPKKIKKTIPNIINNTSPVWTKKPSDLSDDDYKEFYRELYPLGEEPLFHIHLNVDHPFRLTGILYFPKLKNTIEVQKNKIQLYSNQVFITDSVENIVPDFLTLLHGVLDSPDIPLNVSRSYLQSDHNVRKISAHITKKVADKLNSMFNNDREDFQKKWDDIKVFIQYGMLTDEKFLEKATKFALLKSVEYKYSTLGEYKEQIKTNQTDKNNKIIALYTHNKDEHHAQIEHAKERGYDVLIMDSPLDSHFITKLEEKLENVSFARVDADTLDNLIKKTDEIPSKLTKEDEELIKPIIESVVPKEKFSITFESMSEKESPMVVTQSEFMRRMKEQQALGGQNFMGNLPEFYNLVVNANHPLIDKILKEENQEVKTKLAKQVADLALLSKNMLKGEELTKFIKRSLELIN